jgi:hypothetical protein
MLAEYEFEGDHIHRFKNLLLTNHHRFMLFLKKGYQNFDLLEVFVMKKYMKKLLLTTLASSMALSVSVPVMAATNDPTSVQKIVVGTGTMDKKVVDFIKKVDPFVIIDEYTFQYSLDPAAKKSLTKKEIQQAQILIDKSNKSIQAILAEGYELNITPNGAVKVKDQSSDSDKIVTYDYVGDIDTSKYFDYDIEWWGFRFWISPRLVSELQDYNGYISGTAALAAEVVMDLLKRRGISIPSDVQSKISIFAGALVSFGITLFYREFKDTGVFYHNGLIEEGFYTEDNLPSF